MLHKKDHTKRELFFCSGSRQHSSDDEHHQVCIYEYRKKSLQNKEMIEAEGAPAS